MEVTQTEEKSSKEALIEAIDSFLERHDMAPTTFGALAANNGKLVRDLKKNKKRSITLETLDSIKNFMREHDAKAKTINTPTPTSPGAGDNGAGDGSQVN